MNEILIDCKLDFKKYLPLMFYLVYRKVSMIFITLVGLLLLTLSTLYFLGVFKSFDQPPYTQIFLGLVFTFIIPASVYIQAKKNFRSNGRLSELMSYTFTDDMIYINGESFKSEMTWDKLYKVKELKNWILIYNNKITAHIIPKDAFDESQLTRFREIVSNLKTVKTKMKK